MKHLILLLLFMSSNISCNKNNPAKPENHNPIILSLTVFPDVIGISDSAIVVCNAMDPDGDTLVYDWYTDGRLKIKGNPVWQCCIKTNTSENYQILYIDQDTIFQAIDTDWVQVEARDGKGGGDVKLIHLAVKQK